MNANSNPTAISTVDGRNQKASGGDHFHLPLRLVDSSVYNAACISITASANV